MRRPGRDSAACEAAVLYAADHLGSHDAAPTVFDPFCGCGSVLAAANAHGLQASGFEVSLKRARAAAARS